MGMRIHFRERFHVALAAALLLGTALACKKGTTTSTVRGDAAPTFKAGDNVDVLWNGEWWQATVVSANTGPSYKIHYVGWGNEWDEEVGEERIRARTSTSRSK
jgi:hypothetical protein